MRLNPDYLVTFSVVAEYGSISRAAEALNLSQPAVSAQLKALQDAVGERLYTRTAYGITLTSTGQELQGYANVIASTLRSANEHLGNRQGIQRPLRLGISWSLGSFATRIVSVAHQRGLTVRLRSAHSAQLLQAVASGEVDGALVVLPREPLPAGLASQRFTSEDLTLLVHAEHPLAGSGFTPLLSIAEDPFLWPMAGSTLVRHAQRLLRDATVLPPVHFELGSLTAVRDALSQGLGVSILPPSVARAEIEAGQVMPVQIEAPNVTLEYHLVTLHHLVQRLEHRTLIEVMTQTRNLRSRG